MEDLYQLEAKFGRVVPEFGFAKKPLLLPPILINGMEGTSNQCKTSKV